MQRFMCIYIYMCTYTFYPQLNRIRRQIARLGDFCALFVPFRIGRKDNKGFAPMSQAALEVFVSISFSHPVEVLLS